MRWTGSVPLLLPRLAGMHSPGAGAMARVIVKMMMRVKREMVGGCQKVHCDTPVTM